MQKKILLILILTFFPMLAKASLVAHWKMNDDEGTSVVLDSTGIYNGTYKNKDGDLNTNTGASTGKINGALDFDGPQVDGGTDEYIDTGDPFESLFQDSFSISVWVKPSDGQPAHTGWIIGISTALEEDCVWMYLSNAGSVTFQYSSNGNRARLFLNAANPLFSDGQEDWHHLVMVADSTINDVNGIKGYFDGVLQPVGAVSKGDTSNVIFADFASTLNIYIGAENYVGATNHYYGLIDNVMFFDSALYPFQVEYLYNDGDGTEDWPPPTLYLLADCWWL